MSFLTKHWYIPVAAFLVLCGVIGVYITTTRHPAEPQITYVMPEPNPEREDILKRATTPKRIGNGALPSVNSTHQESEHVLAGEHEDMLSIHNESNVSQSDAATGAISKESDEAPPSSTRLHEDDTVSQLELQYDKLMRDAAPLMEQAYDIAASELRPMSIAKRLRFLEEMRIELENDADEDDDPAEEAELNDHVINNFIVAMNERGVYFE